MCGRGGQGGVGALYRVGGRGLGAGGAGGRVCVERVYGRVGSQGAAVLEIGGVVPGVDTNSWPELEIFCHSLAWPAGDRRARACSSQQRVLLRERLVLRLVD